MFARRLLIVVLSCCALIVPCRAVWAQPTLTSTSPGAVAPGKTIDLTLNGTKFGDVLSVWASFPAQLEMVPPADPKKPSATSRVCKVTIEPNVAVGIGGLIVVTKDGYSDLLMLMIDDLPSLAEAAGNNSFEKPQDVSLPAAIDGTGNAGVSDFFRFQVPAGQRVAVEVVASRLATDFDPVLRLLDASGKLLMLADDDASLGADCRFSYTFANAGQYVLEVRDNQFRANGRYRLRIGDFPIVTVAYPLGGQVGALTKFSVLGPDVANVNPFDVTPAANLIGERLPISVKLPNGVSSGMALVASSSLPESVEIEPNNDAAKATPIKVPGAVSGRFETVKDRDYFQFDAKKGQKLSFRAGTRSFGSPAFLKMYLHKADGAQLAESAVTEADEETLAFVVPDDGKFLLSVEDLLKRGGPDMVYRVAIETTPSFSMSLKPDKKAKAKYTMPKNGALAFDVPVTRAGYDGPITLSLAGSSIPFQLFGNVIAEKQATTKMFLIPPADAQLGQFLPLRIVGKAAVGGEAATLSTADFVRSNRPSLAFPPAWLDGLIGVSVTTETPPLYTAKPDKTAVQVATGSAAAEFTIELVRTNKDFKDPLQIYFANLPTGVTAEVKREGNGEKEQYKVVLKLPKEIAVGKTTLQTLSYAELKGAGQAVQNDVMLEITAVEAETKK